MYRCTMLLYTTSLYNYKLPTSASMASLVSTEPLTV